MKLDHFWMVLKSKIEVKRRLRKVPEQTKEISISPTSPVVLPIKKEK